MAALGGVLGLDEAGRGSLVGPLVVGGFLAPAMSLPTLGRIGVTDSKLLRPQRREAIYRRLTEIGTRFVHEIPPAEVDRYVRRGRLNDLEAEYFARIVRRTRPDFVYLDACDPVPLRFGETVRRLSGASSIVHAHHHADLRFPVVGAASIVAKVRRDRAVATLRRRLGEELGSGYPSDGRTVAFVRGALQNGAPDPVWLRRSWATTERLKRECTARTLDDFRP